MSLQSERKRNSPTFFHFVYVIRSIKMSWKWWPILVEARFYMFYIFYVFLNKVPALIQCQHSNDKYSFEALKPNV